MLTCNNSIRLTNLNSCRGRSFCNKYESSDIFPTESQENAADETVHTAALPSAGPFATASIISKNFHRPGKYDCIQYATKELGETTRELPRLHRIDRVGGMSGEMPAAYRTRDPADATSMAMGLRISEKNSGTCDNRAFIRDEKLAVRDVPVDLLSRFSQPAGSSSSAIVVGTFGILLLQFTSNAARLHRVESSAARVRQDGQRDVTRY